MKKKSKKIKSATGWTEQKMLDSIIERVPQFYGDMHSKELKAKVTISVEFI